MTITIKIAFERSEGGGKTSRGLEKRERGEETQWVSDSVSHPSTPLSSLLLTPLPAHPTERPRPTIETRNGKEGERAGRKD